MSSPTAPPLHAGTCTTGRGSCPSAAPDRSAAAAEGAAFRRVPPRTLQHRLQTLPRRPGNRASERRRRARMPPPPPPAPRAGIASTQRGSVPSAAPDQSAAAAAGAASRRRIASGGHVTVPRVPPEFVAHIRPHSAVICRGVMTLPTCHSTHPTHLPSPPHQSSWPSLPAPPSRSRAPPRPRRPRPRRAARPPSRAPRRSRCVRAYAPALRVSKRPFATRAMRAGFWHSPRAGCRRDWRALRRAARRSPRRPAPPPTRPAPRRGLTCAPAPPLTRLLLLLLLSPRHRTTCSDPRGRARGAAPGAQEGQLRGLLRGTPGLLSSEHTATRRQRAPLRPPRATKCCLRPAPVR